MSFSFFPPSNFPAAPPPFPIQGPVRDGEGDVARTINWSLDLGAPDGPGNIPSLSSVTVTLARVDGQALVENDVSLIPGSFSIDSTGLLLTVWFNVPANLPYATGYYSITYLVTFVVNPTSGDQGFKRDGYLTAVATLG
jgi:hypothetical protein